MPTDATTGTTDGAFAFRPIHHVQLALVDGLTALARRLEEAGRPVTWDGDFPGHDRCYAADPFGNRLEFLQPQAD